MKSMQFKWPHPHVSCNAIMLEEVVFDRFLLKYELRSQSIRGIAGKKLHEGPWKGNHFVTSKPLKVTNTILYKLF